MRKKKGEKLFFFYKLIFLSCGGEIKRDTTLATGVDLEVSSRSFDRGRQRVPLAREITAMRGEGW